MLLSPVSLASLSETVTIKTFAVEPMCVPFPPIPTPSARHHHSAAAFTPCASSDIMMGIIAAVNGMLSIAADIIAATHMRMMHASKKSSFTKGMMNVPRYSKKPLPSTPPTIINRAIKNISKGISTSCMMSSNSKCFCRNTNAIKPAPATIHGSQWMTLCITKRTTIAPSTNNDLFHSPLSL